GRPAPAAPEPRLEPSKRGTGARAQPAWSCRDQRVIARQRSDLDLDRVALAALLAVTLELGLMAGIDDRQPAGEHALMASGELAGVQQHRGDVRLGDTDLDATPRERGVDRVVVAIHPHQ